MTMLYTPARVENTFRRMFRDFWTDEVDASITAPSFVPNANVHEDKEGFHIEVDLPGLSKKEIEIEVKDDRLTVRGERKSAAKEEGAEYVRFESRIGRFERTWELEGVDTEKIRAEHQDGVLKLSLPKREEVKRKEEVRKIELH
ncbi:MAG: Hsp20/alpha crystallin family protein [Spirochaetes bacterium]|nr:Hsp20/alpha crystallin family protein [Spirochaetota bacterium]